MDSTRYSRQILTLGKQAQASLSSSKVLVIGLAHSLAMEVLKNLVLQGVGTLYLQDDEEITREDTRFGFYYHHRLGEKRASVLKEKLSILNPYVVINFWQGETVDCVPPVDLTINLTKEINYSRPQIHAQVSNQRGFIFNDFKEHQINDIDGEMVSSIPIKNLTSTGLIETLGYHQLSTDDEIILENLVGDNLLSLKSSYQIKVISPTLLELKDFSETKLTFISGYLKKVKKPMTLSYRSIEEELSEPTLPEDIFHPEFPKEQFEFWKSSPSLTFDATVILTSAYVGALVANETIKYLTKNHQPFHQWYFWEDKSLVLPTDLDRRVFMVGSGAIGCEVLKNLAMLGIKKITITDPDTIEESNLSRQFLFNQKHLNQSKSQSAKETIETFRDDLEITALHDKMSPDNESKFNQEFYQNYDLIFNALDNLQARLYMDHQAVKYHLPLFESGTQGTKGNTQPIIPNLTEHYGATQEPYQEESYPICTVKNFPNKPEHTIHWAKEKFEYLFTEFPSQVNKYLENPSYLESLPLGEKNKLIKEMNRFFKSEDYFDYVINLYHDFFYHSIYQLLDNFPEDKQNDDGTFFWSGGKRCPKALKDKLLNEFIISSLFLISDLINKNYRIYDYQSKIEEIVTNLVPKIKKQFIAKNDEELDKEKKEEKEEELVTLTVKPFQLKELSYDKDDETHSEWVHLASTLRNENYQITPIDKLETRRISGKIIPALATTTSMVSSLITMEMCKYLNHEKLENYRSYFLNSAINQYLYSEPNPPKKTKLSSLEFTIWDRFEEKEDLTVKEFLEKWSEKFNQKLNMIVKDSEMIYSELFSDENILDEKLSNLISKPCSILVGSEEDENLPEINFI